MYKTLHKKQGSVTVQLRFARSSVTFCAKRDNGAAESDNSGNASATIPGGSTSSLMTGYLEASNVDLAKEFSDMITTQRGFQANSKIITVSDEILSDLINMKR